MTSRTERILIIDADEKARADLSRYLEARGFYVSGSTSVASAKTLFDDNAPDVIFADLPPESIKDLASRLEEADVFSPIVCCSTSEASADVVSALRAGAADFVLKPCNNDKGALDDVIEKLFDRVRVNRSTSCIAKNWKKPTVICAMASPNCGRISGLAGKCS